MASADPNAALYQRADIVAGYAGANGFGEPGELSALAAVASHVRGQPVLDVGVGGGRTIPLLHLLTDDYVGIDYAQEMVDRCRLRFPDVDVRHGDARDLSPFEDGQFGWVVFSFNGIDGVGREDRRRILEELHRVLRSDGWLVFSTLNKQGPAYDTRPWRNPDRMWGGRGRRALRWAIGIRRRLPLAILRTRNWLRNRRGAEDHGAWAIAPLHSHDFGLVMHFTTLHDQLDELDSIGFDDVVIFGGDGMSIDRATRDDDTRHIGALHFVAHRP